MAAFSGFHCHAKQCAVADYYRNIHLYFLKGASGSELDNYAQQRALMRSLPWNRKEWFHKIYLYFMETTRGDRSGKRPNSKSSMPSSSNVIRTRYRKR